MQPLRSARSMSFKSTPGDDTKQKLYILQHMQSRWYPATLFELDNFHEHEQRKEKKWTGQAPRKNKNGLCCGLPVENNEMQTRFTLRMP